MKNYILALILSGIASVSYAEPINIDAIMKTTIDAGIRDVMDEYAIRQWYYQTEVNVGNVSIPSHFHIDTADGVRLLPFTPNGSIADTILTQCTMYTRYYVTFECNAALLRPDGILSKINTTLSDNTSVQQATYRDMRQRLKMLRDRM